MSSRTHAKRRRRPKGEQRSDGVLTLESKVVVGGRRQGGKHTRS